MPLSEAQKKWVGEMEAAVSSVMSPLAEPARLLIVAHGAFESGWGTAKAYKRGFNFGNITAGSKWKGAKWEDVDGDTEYDAAGHVKRITQVWRAYPDLKTAVQDYVAFLGSPRYRTAWNALMQGDLPAFGYLLHKCGYYTLPPEKYVKALRGVYELVKSA